MLDAMGMLSLHDGLIEMKIRSKFFVSYIDAATFIQEDFLRKLPKLYPKNPDGSKNELVPIKGMSLLNPKFSVGETSYDEELEEDPAFSSPVWDDKCIGTMFFSESDNVDPEDVPSEWILKYEILFEEDIIDLVSKNGDYAFDPVVLAYPSFTSSVH